MLAISLLLILIIFAQIFSISCVFTVPEKGTSVFCYNLECVAESLTQLEQYNPTVIGVVSNSFEHDSYLGLYLGSILELFDMPEFNFVVLLMQVPSDITRQEASMRFIQLLPTNSIYVCIELGAGMAMLESMNQLGVLPKVVYHLNHEQPWEVKGHNYNDIIFPSVQDLSDFYSEFTLVLRNYYYEPLLRSSYYLPLSAPFEGYVVQNDSSPTFQQAVNTVASWRSIQCHFKGRTEYSKYSYEGIQEGKPPTLIQSDIDFPQAVERREIIRLAQENRLGGCAASSSEISTPGSFQPHSVEFFLASYEEYVQVLADTVFVLCPGGNNVETFRHAEAMEFGAIPVFLRPADPAQNFLNDIHWKGFPGPVLTSWNQLEEFLSSMTDSKMDALQQEVRAWYANAKLTKKQALSHQLRLAFSGVKYASNGTTGDSNNRASIHPVSGKNGAVDANSDVGAAHRVEDIQRIITDLKFNEISPGQYEQNIQSLLAMLIKQDARIKLLERSVQALTDKQ